MISVSRPLVSFAAVLLAGSAALGLYLGYSRANATPGAGGAGGDLTPATTSVAAKAASPIPDSAPPPPVPDEAFIRKIAREEAVAAMHPKRAAPAADDADDSGDDSDAADSDAHAPPPGPLTAPPPTAAPSTP